MLTTVHYLPIACFVLLPSSFIITYMISILLRHCEVAFPYISDTGVHIPESCIFSQLLNLAAFLIGITVAIRFKLVDQQCRDNLLPDLNRITVINKFALVAGLASSAGLSLVANFQEIQLFAIHMIGAFSAFGFGLIYCALQTRLSYYVKNTVQSGLVAARFRLGLTIVLAITFIVSTVFGLISLKGFHGTDRTNWKPSDGGYLYHVISSVSEWISAMAIDFFILSFAHEFKFMTISSPKFYTLPSLSTVQNDPDSEDYNYGVVNVVVNTSEDFAVASTSPVAQRVRTKRQPREVST